MGNLGCAEIHSTNPQTVIDSVDGRGGLAIINHPNWSGAIWTVAEITALTSYSGIEIYNAWCGVDSLAEIKCDSLLAASKKFNLLGATDLHDTADSRANRVWTVINSNACDSASVIAALKSGNFYATQGPSLTITENESVISVTSDSTGTIEFYTANGLMKTESGTSSTYWPFDNDIFVRIKITTASNKKAWSNPLWVY